MNPVAQAVSKIVQEQQAIIGPLAIDQANKVAGLKVASVDDVQITGSGKVILENLVNQYSKIFGKASIQVCKEAFNSISTKIPDSDVPDILKN